MSETPETKYEVPIKQVEKSLKISDRAKTELKSSGMMDEKGKLKLKGVSPKMLKRMKLESVDCPVFNKELDFEWLGKIPTKVVGSPKLKSFTIRHHSL